MQIRDSTTSVFCENVLRNLSLQSWVLCDLHLLLPATKGNTKLKKNHCGFRTPAGIQSIGEPTAELENGLMEAKDQRSFGGSSWGNMNHHAQLN